MRDEFFEQLEWLKAEHGLPAEIRLAVYEDDESLSYFRPGEPWASNEAHTAYMKTLADETRDKFGVEVELVKINTSEYWRWLGRTGRKDGPAIRAEYINL